MANQDPLTGLANRRAFDTALSAALADGSAEGTRFTVLLADIDAFKQINDRFGHTTGDRVLREVAAHTSDEVRPATAWRGSAETSSRWSPRARARRPRAGWPTRCARPPRGSTPAPARSR